MGVMIESNLEEGKQDIGPDGREGLKRGVSVTDGEYRYHSFAHPSNMTAACIHWEDTIKALDRLREGVRARRARLASQE